MFQENGFRHYLGFSASDQRTVAKLVGSYDGLLVPATIATFQREGTAGFVLSLSAKDISPPYVIDPRFPLFQQNLHKIKASHTALAGILNDSDLVSTVMPQPKDFTSNRIQRIATAWVEFNLSYRSQQSAKFAKYAERLGEVLDLADASGPQRVLAPYFCVKDSSDPWWEKSAEFYNATAAAGEGKIDVTRVLAAQTPSALLDICSQHGKDNVCIWVSGLEELKSNRAELVSYANAIEKLDNNGRKSFALYGGFFAVTLSSIGLGGCSHGIGYGEHRNWLELPRSGPPPTRYYLPTIHRYVRQEDAEQLWEHDPRLVAQDVTARPMALEYHELMYHSVEARAEEIERYGSLQLEATIEMLKFELEEFRSRISTDPTNQYLIRLGRELSSHLPTWIGALQAL